MSLRNEHYERYILNPIREQGSEKLKDLFFTGGLDVNWWAREEAELFDARTGELLGELGEGELYEY